MRSEKLNNAVGMIDDRHLERTERVRPRARRLKWLRWGGPVAAVLAAVILLTSVWGGRTAMSVYAISEASYPEMAKYPEGDDLGNAYELWREGLKRQRAFRGAGEGLDAFFLATAPEFLDGPADGNRVYSPLNVYMALAMLAEITDGNSRAQVLELLGASDLEALRRQANAVWNANYRDDGAVTSLLGNSLWLSKDLKYRQETLETLSQSYYASSYQGEMGSEAYNERYREWIDAQTGGLLSDQLKGKALDAETVFAMVSTVCFRAKWASAFSEVYTRPELFHAAGGDVEAAFMHRTETYGDYFWGERFSATKLDFREGAGTMWFLLPDEGVSPEELLRDGETLSFLSGSDWQNHKTLRVNLSVPKFDVRSQLDLKAKLAGLGVTDVFSRETADFTPLFDGSLPAELSAVNHGARVTVDEEGVTAVAYTEMMVAGAAMPPKDEVDFTLDRPFLFVITGADELPLFMGVVNRP